MLVKKLSITLDDKEYNIKDFTIQDFINYIDFVKEIIRKEDSIDYKIQIYYLSYFFLIEERQLRKLDKDILTEYSKLLSEFIADNILSVLLSFCEETKVEEEKLSKEEELLAELYKDEDNDNDEQEEDSRLIYYNNIEECFYNLIYYYCLKTKDSFSSILDKDFIIIMNYIKFIYKNEDNNISKGADIDDLF